MKVNKWTMGLAALGLVSIPATSSAEEGKANGLLTALSSTTISGYVNTSIHWNTGTGNDSLPAHGYNTASKADGFNLDAFKLQIEKPLDEAQWSAGYKAELLFGGDAGAYGTTLDQNGDGSAAAVKQAYVSLRAPVGNGLDFKVGVFDTVIGYEVFDAGNNPNYTRSYGFTIEPTTHTGVLASYQVSSAVSLSAGIGNTIGPVINQKANPPKAESYKTYMGSIVVTAPEDWGFISGSTLYAGVVNGYNTGSDWNQTSYYLGATLNTPVKNLKVGAALDYLSLTDSTVGNNEEEDATAWSLYASFQATEKLSLHLRGEYAETDTALLGTGTGLAGGNSKILALTSTLQYDLWNNVLSRLEVRWDHQAGDGDMTGWGRDVDPDPDVTAGNKRNNVLISANIIYKF
jgi:hypothetical protein